MILILISLNAFWTKILLKQTLRSTPMDLPAVKRRRPSIMASDKLRYANLTVDLTQESDSDGEGEEEEKDCVILPPPGECMICLDEFGLSKPIMTLVCGHSAHQECLQECVQQTSFKKCPGVGCKYDLSPYTLTSILKGDFEAVETRLSENAIAQLSSMRECPFPDCGFRYQAPAFDLQECRFTPCPSSDAHCMMCGLVHTVESACVDAVNAQEGAKEDSLRTQDLAKKEGWAQCPKCRHIIERSFGCKHMTCIKCSFEFCYACNKVGTTMSVEDAEWSVRRCPCQLRRESIFS
jgi:hypothetical protein